MHAVGQHSLRKNEIQLTAFEVFDDYKMEPIMTKIYDMGVSVRVLDITTYPDEDKYLVEVSYVEEGETAEVGRVLRVNLQDDEQAQQYSFMSDLDTFLDNPIERKITKVKHEDDYFLFAGTTNYLEGVSDIADLDINWTKSNKQFGFFDVY